MLIEDDVVMEYVKRFIPLIIIVSVIVALCIGVIIYSLIMEYVIKPKKQTDQTVNENQEEVQEDIKPKSWFKRWWKVIIPVTMVALCAAIVVPVAISLTNGPATSTVVEDDLTLLRIDVKTQPNKTTYQVGEYFDPTGMVVEGTYLDNKTNERSTAEVTDYTIDKTKDVPLTAEDSSVKITYKDKVTSLRIVVEKPRPEFDVDIKAPGDYVIEAEDLDPRTWVAQPGREGMFFESVSNGATASGDKFVGSLYKDTDFNIRFKIDKKYTVSIVGVLAKYEAEYDLNANNNFELNGEKVTAQNVVFGHTDDQPYTTWRDVDFGSFVLDAGTHEFKMLVLNAGPNVDCFKLSVKEFDPNEKVLSSIEVVNNPNKVIYAVGETFDKTGLKVNAKYTNGTEEEITDYELVVNNPLTLSDKNVVVKYQDKSTSFNIMVLEKTIISGTGSYLVEAESLNDAFWNIQPGREGMEIETPANPTSGGKSVGSLLQGSKLVIMFEVTEEVKVNLTATLAQMRDTYELDANASFTLDGTPLTHQGVTFGGTEEIIYTNWKDVVFDEFTMSEGYHVFTMEIIGEGCNIDCFKFEARGVDDVREVTSIEITKQPTRTSYYVGDLFDPTGMEVTAHYSDDTSEVVTNYSIDKTNPLGLNDTLVTISYLGKSATVTIVIENATKLATPDNSTNKLFYINDGNGYIEIDRGASTMFTETTNYVLVHIYDSVDADINASLGTFKMALKAFPHEPGNNVANFESMDGSIKADFHGEPSNYYMEGSRIGEIMNIVEHELGENFSSEKSYYFALQIIAKDEPVNGVQYVDSGISSIGLSAFKRLEAEA